MYINSPSGLIKGELLTQIIASYVFSIDLFTEDHLLISNLRPATTYTVVVEARKMEKYKDIDEGKH